MCFIKKVHWHNFGWKEIVSNKFGNLKEKKQNKQANIYILPVLIYQTLYTIVPWSKCIASVKQCLILQYLYYIKKIRPWHIHTAPPIVFDVWKTASANTTEVKSHGNNSIPAFLWCQSSVAMVPLTVSHVTFLWN